MKTQFNFGLEAEFLFADKNTLAPLWYKDISFKTLDGLIQNISLEGIPSLDGLDPEPPHQKLMPIIVEGYGLVNEKFETIDVLPKGIEIRTPVCQSIQQTLEVYETLYLRMKNELAKINVAPIALSHHPTCDNFKGEQNKRRYDFWQWAQEVMTTYGPDINISFDQQISESIFSNIDDLEKKINYYAPAMTALTLASPFYLGKPWVENEHRGLSYRTHKRSIVAPPVEWHLKEDYRIEFKVFEMPTSSQEFEAYFLMTLGLFLGDKLKGRSSKYERVYNFGQVAKYGLKTNLMRERASELILEAKAVLPEYGFNTKSLDIMIERIENYHCPALDILDTWDKNKENLAAVMQSRKDWTAITGQII